MSIMFWAGKIRKYCLKTAGLTTVLCLMQLSTWAVFLKERRHGVDNATTDLTFLTSDKKLFKGSNIQSHDSFMRIREAPELVKSLQETALDIIRQIIGPIRKGMVFDMGNFENKGDPALALGQLHLMHLLGIEILFVCGYFCPPQQQARAVELAGQFNASEVVIFSSGGGNMGGYPANDHIRIQILNSFPRNKVVILSQSTWFHTGNDHLEKVASAFASHPDLHILLRDQASYVFAKDNFKTASVYLAPDMAFGLGNIPKFFSPIYDVVWIKRKDGESPGNYTATFPTNVTYIVHDWFGHEWLSPKGDDLVDDLSLLTINGLLFIQRGRVLVTDRLHGHILAALMDIPTVIIDNRIKKISNLRNSWSAGLRRVVMARDAEDAAEKAVHILQTDSSIPPLAVGPMI